ncbi:MAG TPA: hypothetical protein PLD20_10155 [Blastocatellia bacterium]|nr:hypothetical protein [Blastocatellia bacterium]HMV83082.1 hypothetical protein [Blastocatellia bacterium]HMX30112.1 hypothetical protein [Blastocatellia bacterium]HMY72838.1 hypothetical protein [Blastocatellia bacterium]HMZ18280.1 hypothetical protein [Blastocatellia bacterium]
MGFIIKCVLVLLVFSFIVYVLKAITRLSAHLRATVKDVKHLRTQGGSVPAGADMVRCVACGAFVSSRDAITLSARNRAQAFCSHECVAAHAKSA